MNLSLFCSIFICFYVNICLCVNNGDNNIQKTICTNGKWSNNNLIGYEYSNERGGDNKPPASCFECPVDFSCDGVGSPTKCVDGITKSTKGSTKCCHISVKCPDGFAVSNYDCSCIPVTCPNGLALMQNEFSINNIDLKCKKNHGCPTSTCSLDIKYNNMIQNNKCQCFRASTRCPDKKTLWRYGSDSPPSYICL
jgi:hypothetical protein